MKKYKYRFISSLGYYFVAAIFIVPFIPFLLISFWPFIIFVIIGLPFLYLGIVRNTFFVTVNEKGLNVMDKYVINWDNVKYIGEEEVKYPVFWILFIPIYKTSEIVVVRHITEGNEKKLVLRKTLNGYDELKSILMKEYKNLRAQRRAKTELS